VRCDSVPVRGRLHVRAACLAVLQTSNASRELALPKALVPPTPGDVLPERPDASTDGTTNPCSKRRTPSSNGSEGCPTSGTHSTPTQRLLLPRCHIRTSRSGQQ